MGNCPPTPSPSQCALVTATIMTNSDDSKATYAKIPDHCEKDHLPAPCCAAVKDIGSASCDALKAVRHSIAKHESGAVLKQLDATIAKCVKKP